MLLPTMAKSEIIDIDDEEEDDDDIIDKDQLDEYREWVEQLGSYPDKVAINSLSMVAEGFADSKKSAKVLYDVVCKRLLNTSSDNILPLVYVLDSILKNVKGCYVKIIEDDAAEWLPVVHRKLADQESRQKLQKVWKLWGTFNIFDPEKWKAMGRCFDDEMAANGTTEFSGSNVAGINRTKDGKLILSATLRKEMQITLDDVQSNITNELEKVSLERLADINPDLLANIKKTAEETLQHHSGSASSSPTHPQNKQQQAHLPAFFTELRSPQTLARSQAWSDLKWNHLEQTHSAITQLQKIVRGVDHSEDRYTQQEAIDMTQFLAGASATATLLTEALERIKNQEDRKSNRRASFPTGRGNALPSAGFAVDKSDFTNDGIKKKNSAVIGILYEVGLPFVSSADGQRFATQLELSNHLDALFRKNQLEKTMARTEERGWFVAENVWCLEENKENTPETEGAGSQTDGSAGAAAENELDPETMTAPADESRDRCVICGINFKMFFDNDDGIYKYNNCREMTVLNDDAAERESEQMLVHVTCWRGLGSPEVLTPDQALQETFT